MATSRDANAFYKKCATNGLSWDETCRRASGRRRYNRRRQFLANYRLTRVVKLLWQTGFGRGYQTRIAKKLGVSALVHDASGSLPRSTRLCPLRNSPPARIVTAPPSVVSSRLGFAPNLKGLGMCHANDKSPTHCQTAA